MYEQEEFTLGKKSWNSIELLSGNLQSKKIGQSDSVKDFLRSLEMEKQLMRLSNPNEIINPLLQEKVKGVVEQSFKALVHTLSEEVNQLRIDKKVLEKKLEALQKGKPPFRVREEGEGSSNMKLKHDSKDNIIQELQFQIHDLQTENKLLKVASDFQKKEIEKLQEEIADKNNLKNIVEETNDEIAKLKHQLDQEDQKKETLKQQVHALHNEVLTQKSKIAQLSQNNTLTEISENMINLSYLEPFETLSRRGSFCNKSPAKFPLTNCLMGTPGKNMPAGMVTPNKQNFAGKELNTIMNSPLANFGQAKSHHKNFSCEVKPIFQLDCNCTSKSNLKKPVMTRTKSLLLKENSQPFQKPPTKLDHNLEKRAGSFGKAAQNVMLTLKGEKEKFQKGPLKRDDENSRLKVWKNFLIFDWS